MGHLELLKGFLELFEAIGVHMFGLSPRTQESLESLDSLILCIPAILMIILTE